MIALPFYKVHGAGNDMLVFSGKNLPLAGRAKTECIRRLAHRNLGVGADQVLEVLSYKPLSIQIWNCDGSRAEMCANGARTFLYLAAQEGWLDKKVARVPLKVSGGKYEGIKRGDTYELSLGTPKILGQNKIKLGKEMIPYWDVNVGNPHAVIFTNGDKSLQAWSAPPYFNYKEYGTQIECNPQFPNKTNVEFVRDWKKKKGYIEVLVEAWERGAGATLSCGSGAVAVATVFHQKFKCDLVKIRMTDFVLEVRFEGDVAHLSGPCEYTAKGTYLVRDFCE